MLVLILTLLLLVDEGAAFSPEDDDDDDDGDVMVAAEFSSSCRGLMSCQARGIDDVPAIFATDIIAEASSRHFRHISDRQIIFKILDLGMMTYDVASSLWCQVEAATCSLPATSVIPTCHRRSMI